MGLPEDDLLLRAMDRPRSADAPLQRTTNAGAEFGTLDRKIADLDNEKDRTFTKHTHVKGKLCAWRCTESGDIQYRELVPEEQMAQIAPSVSAMLDNVRACFRRT